MSKSLDDSQEVEKMERYTFRLPPSLLEVAKRKSGMVPLSKIIRKLLEKWVRGEIEIDYTGDD